MSKSDFFKNTDDSGFTLIEIMVSISIVAVLSVAVLFSYREFNDRISLSASVQQMMSAVRQAQVYGLSVREASSGLGQFNYGYGISVDIRETDRFVLFIDKNFDKVYNSGDGCGGTSTECVELFNLPAKISIADICDATRCPPSSSIKTLNVTFLRPSPDADINFANGGGIVWSGSQALAKIKLASSMGKTAYVIVESTGQIYNQ